MDIVVVRVLIKLTNGNFKFNGTAFFIDHSRLITAKHVVENAINREHEIYITDIPNGGKLHIPYDSIELCERDIAILKTKRRFDIEVVDFSDDLREKCEVTIEGYHNENGSKSSYVHHVSSYVNSEHIYELQSHITNGLSGSPVLLDGKVCGIALAIHRNDNLTFIIPISELCINVDLDYKSILETLEKRQEEIEKYLENDNLDMATKRTMDFVTDFALDKKKKNESVSLRHEYNVLKKIVNEFGKVDEFYTKSEALQKEISSFIKEEKFKENLDQKIASTSDYFSEKRRFQLEQESSVFVAKKVTKKYKNSDFVLKPIDITLEYGEITVVVGENGNGKTTLLDIVAGKLQHTEGEIFFPMLTQNNENDWYNIKRQISYIEQRISEQKGLAINSLHFILAINGVKGQDNVDEVTFIMHRLGLEKYMDSKWSELSGGFKMRFALAHALLRRPKLLILDEPLANLDINTQQLFLNDLRDITSSLSHRMAVIISSQNLYEVEAIADNIIFLNKGESIYNGSMKEFGEQREDNSFEFTLNISEKELLIALMNIDYKEIKREGKNYILVTEKHITYQTLLGLFLTNNIEVQYFRDISKSTRKLFGEINE